MLNIVVTPAKKVTPWSAIAPSIASGSARASATTQPPVNSAAIDVVTRPNAQAIGRQTRVASSGPRCQTRAYAAAAPSSPPWQCMTALGRAVEPDVKQMSASARGSTGSFAPRPEPAAPTGPPSDPFGRPARAPVPSSSANVRWPAAARTVAATCVPATTATGSARSMAKASSASVDDG